MVADVSLWLNPELNSSVWRMEIVDLANQADLILDQAATLLVEGFDEPRGWPTVAMAPRKSPESPARLRRAMIDGDVMLGWVGGLPEYEGRVGSSIRSGGPGATGSRVSGARWWRPQVEVKGRGALTATVGTDGRCRVTSR